MPKSLRFDEKKLVAYLKDLPANRQSLFAAMAATRLAPSFDIYASKAGLELGKLNSALDYLWVRLAVNEGNVGPAENGRYIAMVMELIPRQNDGPSPFGAQADDAAAALAYALRSLNSSDPQEAAWAARRAYESADNLVISHSGAAIGGAAEDRILQHPLIQAELTRQNDDLRTAATMPTNSAALADVRKSCSEWGCEFFKRALGDLRKN